MSQELEFQPLELILQTQELVNTNSNNHFLSTFYKGPYIVNF
jgi:hypothetical protein